MRSDQQKKAEWLGAKRRSMALQLGAIDREIAALKEVMVRAGYPAEDVARWLVRSGDTEEGEG